MKCIKPSESLIKNLDLQRKTCFIRDSCQFSVQAYVSVSFEVNIKIWNKIQSHLVVVVKNYAKILKIKKHYVSLVRRTSSIITWKQISFMYSTKKIRYFSLDLRTIRGWSTLPHLICFSRILKTKIKVSWCQQVCLTSCQGWAHCCPGVWGRPGPLRGVHFLQHENTGAPPPQSDHSSSSWDYVGV